MLRARNAFTLIEVMVAVVIISIVIMALLQMQGNTSHIFSKFTSQLQINQYTSFFISNQEYGFEKDKVDLDDLLSDFDVEDELRRELKKIKVEVAYEELGVFGESEEQNSDMVLEIGKTTLKLKDSSTSLIRLRIQ